MNGVPGGWTPNHAILQKKKKKRNSAKIVPLIRKREKKMGFFCCSITLLEGGMIGDRIGGNYFSFKATL